MEHFGEKDEPCGHIYYNTGLHHEERGELQDAYDNFKQSYLIEKEVLFIFFQGVSWKRPAKFRQIMRSLLLTCKLSNKEK